MKSRKLECTKRVALVGIVATGFLAGIMPSLPAFAGSGGSPGGGDSNCSSVDHSFGAVCNGPDALTWVYYTFDYTNAESQSFNFPGNTRSVGTALVKGCPVGFWHLGYHITSWNTANHSVISSSDGWYYRHNGNAWDRTGAINFHGNDYGQVGSRNTWYIEEVSGALSVWDPEGNIDSESARIRGTQLRESYDGGKSVTAQRFGKPSDVEADFERAKASGLTFYNDNGDTLDGTVWFGQLAWFCYDESMNQTTYTGATQIYDESGAKNNNYTISNIGANSHSITFKHSIHRNDDGPNTGDNERYYVDSNPGSYSEGASNNPKSQTFDRNDTKKVAEKTINVSLAPGESKTVWQTLHYEPTNQTSSMNATPSGACTLMGGSISGRYCAKLSRDPAHFGGSVAARAGNTSKGHNTTTTITSSDGSYTVSFKDIVSRLSPDSAGGTAISKWSTSISVNGSVIATRNADGDTGALSPGGSKTVKDYSGYSYSGTLRYGETHTICNTLKYNDIVNVSGNHDDSKTICVKVYRENAKCAVDSSFTFGIVSAKNAGRIGVENKTLNKTKYSETKLTNKIPSSSVEIYARPTDNIRFKYDMCAGSLYPIKENNLSAKVTYTASGWSTKSPTVNNNNQYLFRTEVPLVGSTFNNPRTWSSSPTPSGFMQDINHLNASFTSPSSGAGSNYRCGNPESGYYQIAGKEDCARNNQNYNIGILDVGSTISQRLTWNEQTVTNRTNVADAPRTATANVIVPYNYTLKPYVTNSNTRAAYIGESITMHPGVAVMARKNESISNDEATNTYATITKKTDVRYSYYFTDASGNLKGSVHSSSETRRFNQEGFSQESINENLSPITVEISDDYAVGDRVCVELSVYPYDSHDGNNNVVALQEGSNSTTRRSTASCLTIAKRPTISIEASNVFSATNITTSIYDKKISANSNAARLTFGSWAEYGVYSRVKKNFLMASGAALAYGRDGTGANTKNLNITRPNPMGNNDTVADETNSNDCTFMTQTFANAECKQSEDMKIIGEISATQFENRTKERYSKIGKNLIGVPQKQYRSTVYLDASNIDPAAYRDDASEPVGIKANNIYLAKVPTFADDDSNHTIVYRATNVVIDGDLNNQVAKSMSTLNNVTGVFIIAENVYLTDAVRYVNATIIADKLNTCAFKSADPTKELRISNLNANVCNQSLIFDSPVITKRLVLNRTAGATNGTGSIVRAEVFNLNSGNYIWSFGQMARYNQAITTYSRELPPKY